MTEEQSERALTALYDIAKTLRASRLAHRASLLHVAAGVMGNAREEWLRHLDAGEETIGHIRAWWKWLDEQPRDIIQGPETNGPQEVGQ